jgi:lysyl-tRNA synthetase class 2
MKNLETYKKWLHFLSLAKTLLIKAGYTEVVTPTLVESPAMEAYLDGFSIRELNKFLPTSPEFGLKKIWLSGDPELNHIFEIAKSFRAEEEQSPFHLKEFTMLELYTRAEDFEIFKRDMAKLCLELIGLPSTQVISCVSLPEVFFSVTGERLESYFKRDELYLLCEKLRVGVSDDDSANDLFQRLYLEFIEPALSKKDFLIVKDYPPFLSALSKISEEGWAERFEFFFDGLELANGYNELLDPQVVEQRWRQENELRLLLGKKEHPIDQELIEAHKNRGLDKGFGIAIGLERLFYLKEKLQGRRIHLKETQV